MIETLRKEENTYWAKIYLSGPIEVAKQIIRRECKKEGLCVTIEQSLFIYTGGEENGYVIGLLNYPRFPSVPDKILKRAEELAALLLEETYQNSALIMSPQRTFWITDREEK